MTTTLGDGLFSISVFVCQRESVLTFSAIVSSPRLLSFSPLLVKRCPMLLFLVEDDNGWVYHPHGTQALCYNLSFEGCELLRSAGWRPYEMHRVSWYLHDSFLVDGLLTLVRSNVEKPSPR
jgi:hypothetical protein